MCNEQVKSAALEGAHRLFAVGLLYPNATKSQTSEEAEEVVANTMLDALGAFIGTPTADDEARAREIVGTWVASLDEGVAKPPGSITRLTVSIAEALTRSRSDLIEKIEAQRDEWQAQGDTSFGPVMRLKFTRAMKSSPCCEREGRDDQRG